MIQSKFEKNNLREKRCGDENKRSGSRDHRVASKHEKATQIVPIDEMRRDIERTHRLERV